MQKRDIAQIETLSAEVASLYEALNKESDLACILISASFLDECLASLLSRYLTAGDVSDHVLATSVSRFAARADLACALGLIPVSLHENLKLVAKLRNEFAHSRLLLSFSEPRVRELCQQLSFPVVANEYPGGWDQYTNHPRNQFTVVVALMANRLILASMGAEQRNPQVKGWR